MLRVKRSLIGALACVVAAGSLVAAGAGLWAPAAGAQTAPTLVAVRAAHHPGYDRLVFQFSGALPANRTIGYVTTVIADPSGKTVAVQGRYYAVIHMSAATAWNGSGFSTPAVFTPLLPNLKQVVRSGDFEATLSFALGLSQHVPIKVSTLTSPSRVVVDIPVMTWPLLSTGSSGSDVLAAQYMLRARGAALPATGVFGSSTRAAVVAFQRSRNLAADGMIGVNTWSALMGTVRYGSRGDMVRALQVELNHNGRYVVVDGVFGLQTRAAVLALQTRNWLATDTIVGPMTWTALVCNVATW